MQFFTFVYLLVKCPVIGAFGIGVGGGFTTFSRRREGFPFSPAEKNIILASGSFCPS